MDKKKKSDQKKAGKLPKKRYTIGLLTDIVAGSYAADIVRAAEEFTRAEDINLLNFSGGILDNPNGFWSEANTIYDLVAPENVDALVVASGMLGAYISTDELKAFFERFPIPVVSLGMGLEGVPSVLPDNYTGLHAAIMHLVKDHGHRRIIFLKGPEGHPEAEERYQAYADAMTQNGLSVAPELVLPGDFLEITGRDMISSLIDAKGADFDALVAANDEMAFGAIEALQKHGIRVPYDVAVVGFDNTRRCDFVMPPLTTVQQPIKGMVVQSIKMLLVQLAGEEVPGQMVLPTELVLRQSCGCQTSTVIEAALGSVSSKVEVLNKEEALEIVVFQRREEILFEMRQVVDNNIRGLKPDWAERLLDAFWAALTTESSHEALDDFLPVLNEILRDVVIGGNDVRVWQGIISVLRREILPFLRGKELLQAEDIWQQARVVMGEISHWVPSYEAQQAAHRAEILRDISANLISAFDVGELLDALAYHLPRLGIGCCYLSLYEDPQNPVETSRLMFALNEQGRITLESGGQVFPSRQLVPDDIMSRAERYGLIVAPLYFKEEQFGFVLFAEGQPEEIIYEVLRGEICSALQGALLVEKHEQTEQAISKRVSELELVAQVSTATSTILETTDLLQRVVDLIKDSFGLYHTHIYLLNEAADTLILTAGAGSVGQQMVAEGWRIPLDSEQSLVSRVARSREGIIVNNVHENPDWLPNRLLPNTNAEMAVPLMAGERLLGVLDVQADTVDYFVQDDIRIQTTLASQVAVTLENARLFEETQGTLTETANLYETSRRINEANDLNEIMIAIAEAGEISEVNRMLLNIFEHNSAGQADGMIVAANWFSGQGSPPLAVGLRFSLVEIPYRNLLFSSEPVFIDDVLHDDRLDFEAIAAIQETHVQSMAILPLWVGDRQLGVLLLRAEEVHHFTQSERRLYTSLAQQVAVAVENQQLLAETQSILAELEATQRRYTIQAWDSYRKRSSVLNYEQVRLEQVPAVEGVVEDRQDSPRDITLLTDGGESTTPANGSMQDDTSLQPLPVQDEVNLVVPLKIRGEEIGVLGIAETGKKRAWSPEEIALVEAIAEQVAQAAENLRLIEETQQAAARETRVNEIGDKIQSAQSLEEALRIAVREVGTSLKVPQTAVQLKVHN